MSIVWITLFLILFGTTSLIGLVLGVRQLIFSFAMANKPLQSKYGSIDGPWPTVSIIVAAHNEEFVIAGCLDCLTKIDYPAHLLDIIIVNDRSTDNTRKIVDEYAKTFSTIRALHRDQSAKPGKPAAIADVLKLVKSELLVFFDADYRPTPPLIKKLVAPLVDPQIGATMGRVVPDNTETNLMTRLLDLERRAGYGIDQAARGRFGLVPQFGGTVGAVRISAMNDVGGWQADTLAEDTDLTYRLFIKGWLVEYVDDALCYEESPQDWRVRFRQVRRWASGHNQCLFKYFLPTLTTKHQPFLRRLDAALILFVFLLPPLAMMSLLAAIIYPTLYAVPPFNFAILAALSFFVGFGNFAPYYQIVAAALRDRDPQIIAFMPLLPLSSALSMWASTQGLYMACSGILSGKALRWDKTVRYRIAEATT